MAQFAEETNHKEIVPQCLGSVEIKNKVTAFWRKTGFVDETETDSVKKEKSTFWEPVAKAIEKAKILALQFPMPLQLIFDGEVRNIEEHSDEIQQQ